jgi:hypothetical protein
MEKVKVNLNSQDKWVDISSIPNGKMLIKRITVKDTINIEYDEDMNNAERGLVRMSLCIKEWNLQDENGNDLPVNLDNIKNLLTETDLMEAHNVSQGENVPSKNKVGENKDTN